MSTKNPCFWKKNWKAKIVLFLINLASKSPILEQVRFHMLGIRNRQISNNLQQKWWWIAFIWEVTDQVPSYYPFKIFNKLRNKKETPTLK